MTETTAALAYAYFSQQAEMGTSGLMLEPVRAESAPAKKASFTAPGVPLPAVSASVVIQSENIGIVSYDQKRAALVTLYRSSENCRECQLGGSRKKFVFGSGNAGAPLMVIGEAPGEEEDERGLPFVGAAGQLLTKMLAAINLDRKNDVFITNILKCRPPGNRMPDLIETTACLPMLRHQIRIIAPKIILVLGRVAAQELLCRSEAIAQLRTEKLDYNGIPAVVTYHPAALLRNAQYKTPAHQDLLRLQKMLNELKGA